MMKDSYDNDNDKDFPAGKVLFFIDWPEMAETRKRINVERRKKAASLDWMRALLMKCDARIQTSG